MMRSRFWIFCGAMSAAVAVALGAAAAHALETRLTAENLELLKLGANYQLWHALALIATGLMPAPMLRRKLLAASGGAFLVGSLLFSGGLYNLAFEGLPLLHPVVPIGGSLLILGWLLLGITALTSKKDRIHYD